MKTLPEQPNLEFLRREARTLRAQHRAKDKTVCEIIAHFDTSFHGLSHDEIFSRKFSIIDAQRVTARRYSFASWRRLKLFVQKSTVQTSEFDSTLREEFIRRNLMLKALIRRSKNRKPGSREVLDKFIDESHALLENTYHQHGWPGPQIVGRDGTEACFWMGVSNSRNAKFQYKTAMLMKDSLPKGECYGIQYAITIDRWLCLSYQPTIYGSFNDFNKESGRVEYTSDVIDPQNLNRRRAEVGLPNFEADNGDLRRRSVEQKWPEYEQATWEKMKRKWAVDGGYITA